MSTIRYLPPPEKTILIIFNCPKCFTPTVLKSSATTLIRDHAVAGNVTCSCASVYRIEVVLLRESETPQAKLIRTVDGNIEHPLANVPVEAEA